MVSCIKIETASLVFACLSLITTSIGSLVCIAFSLNINILVANSIGAAETRLPPGYYEVIESFGLYINVFLAVILSILAVALAFSIILTKGLVSKQAHLIKAYFIYGVTINTLSLILIVVSYTISEFQMHMSLIGLFGCVLYGFILRIIQKTYLKLSNIDSDQFCHKKLEAEKSIA